MLTCPQCGSRDLRHSHFRNAVERLGGLFGIYPLRCRVCRARFVVRTWRMADLRYAKCPKCMRMDLSVWSETHYRVATFKSFLLSLGANPYRCESCRHNFISFRRRKERFRRKRSRSQAGPDFAPNGDSAVNTEGDGI